MLDWQDEAMRLSVTRMEVENLITAIRAREDNEYRCLQKYVDGMEGWHWFPVQNAYRRGRGSRDRYLTLKITTANGTIVFISWRDEGCQVRRDDNKCIYTSRFGVSSIRSDLRRALEKYGDNGHTEQP